jgi:hypothetical protein
MSTFYTYKLPQKDGVVTPNPDETAEIADWLSTHYPNFNSDSFYNSFNRELIQISSYHVFAEYIIENGKLISIRYETSLSNNEEFGIDPEWKEYHLFFMNHPSWDTPGSWTKDPT